MSKIIGIDFGTTKTVAAVINERGRVPTITVTSYNNDGSPNVKFGHTDKDGTPSVISDRRGRKSMPSLVLITPETEKSVFVGWEAKEHPNRYQINHLTISSIKRLLGKEHKNRWGWVHEHPEAVAGLILARLKLEIEHQLGERVEEAVIAIPANYNINQRWAIKQAAELARLKVLRLINEATAAAFYYQSIRPQEKTLMIFDFGGGTLDVSVVEIGEGVCEVKATAGDGQLGGDDFDQVLLNYVLQNVFPNINDFNSLELFQQLVLREAVTKAKIELSTAHSTRIYLPGFIKKDSNTPQILDITIDREKFIALSRNLLKKTEEVIKSALKDAGIEKPDAVLIIGGGSRIPAVRELVRQVVGIEPFVGVDPETCVAQGAAILAGIFSGNVTDMTLLDVLPNSLSIETLGGIANPLINKNTTIPTRKSEIFYTAEDNQTEVSVKVYAGERPLVSDNIFVGSLQLSGIKPAPRGTVGVEVVFDIWGDGFLEVSANTTDHKIVNQEVKTYKNKNEILPLSEDSKSVKKVEYGKQVKAKFDAPFNLKPEEIANSKKFMAEMISKIAVQLSWEEEKDRHEKLKITVAVWVKEIENLIEANKDNLDESQISFLTSSVQLLFDYFERGSSYEDLERIYVGLKQQIEAFLEEKQIIPKEMTKLEYEQIEQNFAEIHPLMTKSEAILEANRCLYCYDAPCTRACPTHIDVPAFIKKIASGNLVGSAKVIFDANPIGSSCAKVCPVEVLCEGACVEKTLVKKPIEIGRLQRYATELTLQSGKILFEKGEPNGKSVGIIGSGPAGLSCATYLARLGYAVTVYEKRELAGGLDTYGMAEYKMTQAHSLAEVKQVESLGVEFKLNIEIGNLDELTTNHDAVFLAIGLGKTNTLNISGEEKSGVMDALQFIEKIKTRDWQSVPLGKTVAVIGAGNTAIDAVTQAKRLGAEKAILVYRRTEKDAPAYDYEIELAKSDAIEFAWEHTPIEILGDRNVTGLKCKKADGSEVQIACDMVIKAIGQQKQVQFLQQLGLNLDEKGRVVVNESMQTSNPKVFAGGDCVNGGKEAVDAAQMGKKAAIGIHFSLTGETAKLKGASI